MPNRVIREAILTSDKVNALDWVEEIFFRRLLSIVDDFGRYDARASVLRCALYPLKLESMPNERVQACLDAVEAAGLVTVYTVDGKPYLEVAKFSQHVRAKKSRFPAPNNVCTADAVQMQRTCSANAAHVQCERSADEVQMQSECGADAQRMQRTCCTRARVTESESESESINTVVVGKATASSARESAALPPPPDEYMEWIGKVAQAHPSCRKSSILAPDVDKAARAAFERCPSAAEQSELLRAYLADRMQEDRYRHPFYRPTGQAKFFEHLEDVLAHAERWAKEKGWKPAGARSAAKVEQRPADVPKCTPEEREAFLAELRKIRGEGGKA